MAKACVADRIWMRSINTTAMRAGVAKVGHESPSPPSLWSIGGVVPTSPAKHALAGNWLQLSFDNFSMSSLRLFQPRAFDVRFSRTVKLNNQRADELCFVFEAQ